MEKCRGLVDVVKITNQKENEFNGKQVTMCNVALKINGGVYHAWTSLKQAESIKQGDDVEFSYAVEQDQNLNDINKFKMKDNFVNHTNPQTKAAFGGGFSKYQADPAKDVRITYLSVFSTVMQAIANDNTRCTDADLAQAIKWSDKVVNHVYEFKIDSTPKTQVKPVENKTLPLVDERNPPFKDDDIPF